MNIRDIFDTKIHERIEAVVKVADRDPVLLLSELKNLVVTPQWERHLKNILEAYAEAFDREDERDIGIWISGFFGSGKSLLMKVLGLLLEGGEIQGEVLHDIFLNQLPQASTERADITRALAVCQRKISTSLVGGNLHARQAKATDPLALITFKLFAESREYTNNWAFAWAIEYHIDLKGRTNEFRALASELSGTEWREIAQDSDIYGEILNTAVAQIMPDLFSGPTAVANAVTSAFQQGIDAKSLVERLHRWCVARDHAGMRHKMLMQLDELGQWIRGGSNTTDKLMEVQALVETASSLGQGRIWIAVTAHGDVQELQSNVQQTLYATINQRFAIQCKLTNEDINAVVQERLLRKKATATSLLREQFQQHSGELIDLGTLKNTRRIYVPPDEQNFAQYYPYFPWTVTAIPNIVKGIAQSTGRDEALTGSNRTMISMVQSGIIDTKGLLDAPIGRVLSLADLYEHLSGDAPSETRTDLNRILVTVPNARELTVKVARVLYLLGRDQNIPCSLDNITRALVKSFGEPMSTLRTEVEMELQRLLDAGYAKKVGEIYEFLSTQQRTFQKKIREREAALYDEVYELSQKLKEYDSEDMFRFESVSVKGVVGAREKLLRVELDTRVIKNVNNPAANVTVRVYSPLQRLLDTEIQSDEVLKQRSNEHPNSFLLRMGESKDFRRILARAIATREVIDETTRKAGNDPEKKVAEQANDDAAQYKDDVRDALNSAMRGSVLFFRGSPYALLDGTSPNNAVRNTLSHLLPEIYSQFASLPHRVVNEDTAVKAALRENTSNEDLQKLGVFTNDGQLNGSCTLLSTLRGKLPQAENDQGNISADTLRSELEKPPFGWDGNAVKVGLALLLRAAQCRLLVDGRPLTDPRSPEVEQVLIKDLSFKKLRVQGVRSDLKSSELLTIRGYIEMIFQVKVAAVAATLNTELGKQLEVLTTKERTLHEWAATTSCHLPTVFESGRSLVAELLENAAFSSRLPLFLSKWEMLNQHMQLVETLQSFKNEYGTTFLLIRDFYNTMLNADSETLPEEVRTLREDWYTVMRDRTVTDLETWNTIVRTYRNAQQAITNQIALWRQEVEQGLAELEASLKPSLQQVGVPDEQLETEATALATSIQTLHQRLAKPDVSYSDIKGIRNGLASTRVNLPNKLREVQLRYQPKVTETPQDNIPQEVHLTWRDVMGGAVRITSHDDVERVITRLKDQIGIALTQQKSIIIE